MVDIRDAEPCPSCGDRPVINASVGVGFRMVRLECPWCWTHSNGYSYFSFEAILKWNKSVEMCCMDGGIVLGVMPRFRATQMEAL